MLISDGLGRAFDAAAARERDVLHAYTPGTLPEKDDVAVRRAPLPDRDPLAVTAPAGAYFITSDSRGRSLFGRDGRFSFRSGALVDSQGDPVLGFSAPGSALAPLRANAADAALGYTNSAAIAADGSVTYERRTIDPRSGNARTVRTCIGRIALARFSAGTKLQAADAQHFYAPAGIVPHIGRAADGNFESLTPFTQESGGIDIDAGLERLEEAYLAIDALRAASIAQFGTQKTAMDLLK